MFDGVPLVPANIDNTNAATTFTGKRETYMKEIRSKQRRAALNSKRQQPDIFSQSNQTNANTNTENVTKSDESRLPHLDNVPNSAALIEKILSFYKLSVTLEDLSEIYRLMTSKDIILCHKGIILLRKLLLEQEIEAIQPIIDFQFIPIILKFVEETSQPHLQLEAAWAIANIVYGEKSQIMSLFVRGLLKVLPKIILSPHEKISEQGIWIVGNIAAEDDSLKQ